MTARTRVAIVLLTGTAVVAVVVALALSFDLRHLDATAVATRVQASGSVGPLVLIALLVAQAVIAPLPAPPILMAAGFVYGPWVGFGIGWLGLLLGAGACFGLARWFGLPFARRFVGPERLATIEERLDARAGTTVVTLVSLRVFLPPLFDAVSYACGLFGVPLPVFLLATGIGEIPKVASFAYIGSAAGEVPGWLTTWVFLFPVVGVFVLRMLHARRARARERTETRVT